MVWFGFFYFSVLHLDLFYLALFLVLFWAGFFSYLLCVLLFFVVGDGGGVLVSLVFLFCFGVGFFFLGGGGGGRGIVMALFIFQE